MTRDDILRWAKEAGIDVKAAFPRNPDVLTRFAQLAVDAAQPATAPDVQPVAWRIHPFDYGIGDDGVHAVTQLAQQRDVWIRKGWNAEPLYTHPPATSAQPVAWIENLTDPQPDAVTDLKYCSVAQHDRGDHLKYVPLFMHPPAADVAELVEALKLALDSHGVYLLTDPPQDAWKARDVERIARAALAKWEGK